MKNNASEKFVEIKQLIDQFRQETRGDIRSWPDTIKSRVIQLYHCGLSAKEISLQSGISRFTISKWRQGITSSEKKVVKKSDQNTAQFNAVKIRDDQSRTMSITLPNGMRIDGVTTEFLLFWLERSVESCR